MNAQDSKAETFEVFLCHNSEDKPAVREIAQKLSEENIKPWLDEADIRTGSFWHTAIAQQIETVNSAAVFVGESGVGPWQNREIIALLDQFDRRGCPVIPVILASDHARPVVLPWSLMGFHCVDFREPDSQPLKRLIWGITGQKPAGLSNVPSSEKPATMREAAKCHLLPRRDEHAAASKARSDDPEISEARLYPPLAEPPDQEQASQLKILRGRVMEYWVDGVLKHSLYNEVLISLGKRQIDKAVDAPWKYTVEVSDATNSAPLEDRDVSAIYDATGLLLILGEPGSGKTTTLLDLARTLLERAQYDIKERVPIVLNLSSWKKKQPLAEWISGELSEKYRVPRKIARFWLQHNYLLPLLDGLDEIETLMQPDCVNAINAFMEELKPAGVVVCSRLNEYRWLPERLKLNGAICLEPLSFEEVSKYLAMGGSKLAALREAVDTDPVLQELAQTPLMLSVMSLACQGGGGDELATRKGDSAEKRRKQIFGLYVEQMFQRKGTSSLVFPKEKIIHGLSCLAGKMREHSQSVFLVEGLQPSWLGTRAKRVAYGTVVALSLALIFALISGPSEASETMVGGARWRADVLATQGLIYGLIISIGVGLGCWSESPLKNGVMSGLIGGLIGGLFSGRGGLSPSGGLISGLIVGWIGGSGVGSLNHITLVETITWKWSHFWKRTIPGLILGPIVGLLVGLLVGLIYEMIWPSGGLGGLIIGGTFGLVVLGFGLIVGLASGLIGGFTDRVMVDKASPNQGIKLSRKNCFAAFLVTCLAVGLSVGLIGGLFSGRGGLSLSDGLSFGSFAGLFAGVIVGLNRGGSAVIKHYALRLTLWLNGYTPFKFIKFLDHCARLILLKKVGGGYIFIHRMLLEYFAEMAPSRIGKKM